MPHIRAQRYGLPRSTSRIRAGFTGQVECSLGAESGWDLLRRLGVARGRHRTTLSPFAARSGCGRPLGPNQVPGSGMPVVSALPWRGHANDLFSRGSLFLHGGGANASIAPPQNLLSTIDNNGFFRYTGGSARTSDQPDSRCFSAVGAGRDFC